MIPWGVGSLGKVAYIFDTRVFLIFSNSVNELQCGGMQYLFKIHFTFCLGPS